MFVLRGKINVNQETVNRLMQVVQVLPSSLTPGTQASTQSNTSASASQSKHLSTNTNTPSVSSSANQLGVEEHRRLFSKQSVNSVLMSTKCTCI